MINGYDIRRIRYLAKHAVMKYRQFSEYCIWLIKKAIEFRKENSYDPEFEMEGDTTTVSCIVAFTPFKDDRYYDFIAGFERDSRGTYVVYLWEHNDTRKPIICKCEQTGDWNADARVQRILNKFLSSLSDEDKCIMEISELKSIKEVFDL